MEKSLTFSFDVSRCSGCFACVVACQDQNDGITDVSFRSVVSYEDGSYPNTKISFLSIACFHCGDAPCLNVCPTGAIFKHDADGVVDLNRDLCVGCHSCSLVCPFGTPKFSNDGKMAKCNLCETRVSQGLEPACVRTCTTRALGYGSVDKIANQKATAASIQIIKSIPSI